MSEFELIELCKEKSLNPHSFWTAESYGFGMHIRNYGYFPSFLPLCVNVEHSGPGLFDTPMNNDLYSPSPLMLYHSPRLVDEWKKISKKPCFVMFSPFVFYRRKNKIEKEINAIGTIAFPAHSTGVIDDESDIEIYLKELLSLPEEFQPVSVCLHIAEIQKGVHHYFFKHNIPVYTAGHPYNQNFTERFYSILKNFKYSTSNFPMSCLFFSVEMGIPHFIYGNPPAFNNKGDICIPLGKGYESIIWKQREKIKKMFSGLQTEITLVQKEIVEFELGITNGISRLKMARILYQSFAIHSYYLIKHKLKLFLNHGKDKLD